MNQYFAEDDFYSVTVFVEKIKQRTQYSDFIYKFTYKIISKKLPETYLSTPSFYPEKKAGMMIVIQEIKNHLAGKIIQTDLSKALYKDFEEKNVITVSSSELDLFS